MIQRIDRTSDVLKWASKFDGNIQLSFYTDSLSLEPMATVTLGRSSAGGRYENAFYTLAIWTPTNDILIGDKTVDLLLGRAGNDRLIGVNPADAVPGKGEIDFYFGSLDISTSGQPNTPENNVFILGDEKNPYYVGGTGILGTGDFALLGDFKAGRDTIQLNGTSKDYFLTSYRTEGAVTNSRTGTAIFRAGSNPDLVALLPGVRNLDLNAKYFEYINSPPPIEIVSGVKQFGSPGFEVASDVDSDRDGNVYVSGYTTGNSIQSSPSAKDAFLAKYDKNGNQLWIKQYVTPGFEAFTSVVVDVNNNVYTSGTFVDEFGGPTAGGYDAYINKFDSNGNLLWSKQIANSILDVFFDIAADKAGNVFVTGFSAGDLEATDSNSTPISFIDDSFIAKYDTNGNLQWIRQFGTPLFDEGYGITVDPEGNVIATGWTQGNLAAENAGLYDGFFAKYDTNGNQLWIKQFGTPGYEFPWDIAADSFGNVYSVGFTSGSLGATNAGFYDVFVAKYDRNGNQVWIKQLGTSESENAYAIDIDPNNNLLIAGFTTGTLGAKNAGGGDNAGSDDAFWAKLDINGNLLEVNQFGTSRVEQASAIDASIPGRVVVAGLTNGSPGEANKGSFDVWVRWS